LTSILVASYIFARIAIDRFGYRKGHASIPFHVETERCNRGIFHVFVQFD